jgi:hypothetical protein
MIDNLRILDCDLQLCRTFGLFIAGNSYDTFEHPSGTYDLIFTHREKIQDDFDSIKKYTKPNSKIITDISTESGNIDDFLIPYKKIVKSEPYQFYLICDAPIPNKEQYGNNVKILDSHDLVFYAHLNSKSDNFHILQTTVDAFVHDGFLSLNNSCRMHRVYLLTQLLDRNLPIDKCSFLFSTGTPSGWKYNEDVFKSCLDILLETNIISNESHDRTLKYDLPKILDYDNRNPTFIHNDLGDLYNIILNLVTENLTGMANGDVSDDKIFTFTEKTIKPFLAKQIPLFFALPGHLNVLRNLGFDLFDDLIDNSYDTEMNHVKRLDLILNELQRLMQVDLIEFKSKNKNRFDSNFKLLDTLTQRGENLIKIFLYEEILK